MAWRIEFAPEAVADLETLFDHLQSSRRQQGWPDGESARMAAERIRRIIRMADRIAIAPLRDHAHEVAGRRFRHLTLDRAIFWYTTENADSVVRIEAIFHGGQDHMGRMLARLTGEDGD